MLEMIKSVLPNLAEMDSSSRCGSPRVSGDSGFRKKFIDLCTKVSKPPPWPRRRSFLTVV